jgi:secernin
MCDTFVALSNSTKDGSLIFGKNSDRPNNEVQLITYAPKINNPNNEKLKCTYISIPQVSETNAILLSQPWWMWGAEMGCNEYGVVIGNEAVQTLEILRNEGLLGMDLLRLGLERAKSARKAVEVITNLLETYHQGGGCAYNDPRWTYHNSFIIADPKEAYVLETADDWWIVELVKDVRSISNSISVRGKGDMRRNGIIQYAIEKGYCRDDAKFDFAITFSGSSIPNYNSPFSRAGKSAIMLNKYKGEITVKLMMEFLREHEAGICMHGGFESTGSQVSQLKDDNNFSIHWFTGTILPCLSIYKPYIFPLDNQVAIKPGPYLKIDPKWHWNIHSNFIKNYVNYSNVSKQQSFISKSRALENVILEKINSFSNKNYNLSIKKLYEKVKELNLEAWESSKRILK